MDAGTPSVERLEASMIRATMMAVGHLWKSGSGTDVNNMLLQESELTTCGGWRLHLRRKAVMNAQVPVLQDHPATEERCDRKDGSTDAITHDSFTHAGSQVTVQGEGRN